MLPGGQRAHSTTSRSTAPSSWSANLQVQRACARLIVRACDWAALRFVLSEQNATLRPEERSKLLNVSPETPPRFLLKGARLWALAESLRAPAKRHRGRRAVSLSVASVVC